MKSSNLKHSISVAHANWLSSCSPWTAVSFVHLYQNNLRTCCEQHWTQMYLLVVPSVYLMQYFLYQYAFALYMRVTCDTIFWFSSIFLIERRHVCVCICIVIINFEEKKSCCFFTACLVSSSVFITIIFRNLLLQSQMKIQSNTLI